MNIAILGTKGIPNAYGGFEQFAEYLSVGFVRSGHSVTVYSPYYHEYKQEKYKNVNICRIYSPEKLIGASANFLYDFLCLKDALTKNFDLIYELGYHSNAPSYYLLDKNSPPVVTNMDGLEWQRSKWNTVTRRLIKRLEKLAVQKSDYLISDNTAIQQYYIDRFGRSSYYLPYGADIVEDFDEELLSSFNIVRNQYFLLIARLEPENNVEMILDGLSLSDNKSPIIIVGANNTKYGCYLQQRYTKDIFRFVGGIYDKKILDSLRHYALLYFHGHSVGGTNPSLLEAMAAGALIAAHDNPFNKSVLGTDSYFFKNKDDVFCLLKLAAKDGNLFGNKQYIDSCKDKIRMNYSWNKIVKDYETLFKSLIRRKQKKG